MNLRQPEYGVRYTVVDRNDRIVTRQKFFVTQEARQRWLEKNADSIVETLAFSNPREAN